MRCVYSVIRFVPDPARGEFVNVGLVAGSDETGKWEVRQVENLQRARRIDDRRSINAIASFIDTIGRRIDDYAEDVDDLPPDGAPSEGWLSSLANEMRNVIQLTPPAPVSVESVSDALDLLFEELIVDPSVEHLEYMRLTAARSRVRTAYRDASLVRDRDFFEHVGIETEGHRETLDFAVANGRVVQLAQTWSFQIPNQDRLSERVRAWGWTIAKLKERGGELLTPKRRLEITRDVELAIVFVPPTPDQPNQHAFNDAAAVVADVRAAWLPMSDADEVGRQAARLLGR